MSCSTLALRPRLQPMQGVHTRETGADDKCIYLLNVGHRLLFVVMMEVTSRPLSMEARPKRRTDGFGEVGEHQVEAN